MFKKAFNKLFSKKEDEVPSKPERRVLPEGISDVPRPDWITSKVFYDPEDKNRRIYFAASPAHEYRNRYKQKEPKVWIVAEYSYLVSPVPGERWSGKNKGEAFNVDEALRMIARLEKNAQEDLHLLPVPGLEGNYREVANLCGGHFDDNDKYISVSRDRPAAETALFARKSLDALYKPKEETAPFIRTWDDFYREIVHQKPLNAATLEAVKKKRPSQKGGRGYQDFWNGCAKALDELKGFDLIMKDKRTPQWTKESAIKSLLYWPISFSLDEPEFSDIQYHGHVAIVAAWLRTGAEEYSKFVSNPAVAPENIQLLSLIASEIVSVAQVHLGLTPAQAKELANLVMQGPDPYANKPLPLEEFFRQCPKPPEPPKKGGGHIKYR